MRKRLFCVQDEVWGFHRVEFNYDRLSCVPCSSPIARQMELAASSETLMTIYETAWCCNPEHLTVPGLPFRFSTLVYFIVN
jgi:hypothetical protein